MYPAQIIRKVKGLIWGPKYGVIELAKSSDYLEKVVGLIDKGEAKVVVQEVVSGALSDEGQWEKAIEIMNSGRVRGKIVLAISAETLRVQ
jgi:NADPH:quinone reductase-like Zn-dependent oxidoreductase